MKTSYNEQNPSLSVSEPKQIKKIKIDFGIALNTLDFLDNRNLEQEKNLVTQFDDDPENSLRLKFMVFSDLWNKGFYVLSGSKFGGDYVLYPGDPDKYHSQLIVFVVSWEKYLISVLDIVGKERLANSVGKATVLATVDPLEGVKYLTFKWQGVT
eukprot:TRINITY_DN5176_c0_g1_i1.p1 TRINITY_DN5176_c0_g1~~TRINITY_DN5176_c0_g1_i1.p1  ORF type:complete len:155 (+),score=33.39 TRINITY_DN5176_c0_g1_i1:425-889(+)